MLGSERPPHDERTLVEGLMGSFIRIKKHPKSVGESRALRVPQGMVIL